MDNWRQYYKEKWDVEYSCGCKTYEEHLKKELKEVPSLLKIIFLKKKNETSP